MRRFYFYNCILDIRQLPEVRFIISHKIRSQQFMLPEKKIISNYCCTSGMMQCVCKPGEYGNHFFRSISKCDTERQVFNNYMPYYCSFK